MTSGTSPSITAETPRPPNVSLYSLQPTPPSSVTTLGSRSCGRRRRRAGARLVRSSCRSPRGMLADARLVDLGAPAGARGQDQVAVLDGGGHRVELVDPRDGVHDDLHDAEVRRHR